MAQPEGKTLAFKRDLSSPEKALRAIIAFANTAGGTLLIEVEESTRQVGGVADVLLEEERLTNLIHDQIAPHLIPEIEILPWRRTHLLAVHIYPSGSCPYHLKKKSFPTGVFVRVGSTNRQAEPGLIEEMRRYACQESYEEQPLAGVSLDALDLPYATACFAPVRKLQRADLRTLRVVTKVQGREVLTVGGILLFGGGKSEGSRSPMLGSRQEDLLDQREIRFWMRSRFARVSEILCK